MKQYDTVYYASWFMLAVQRKDINFSLPCQIGFLHVCEAAALNIAGCRKLCPQHLRT